MIQHFGTEDFTIRCGLDPPNPLGSRIGSICFELAGDIFGDFEQPCVIGGVAAMLDATLTEIHARKDLLLSTLDPALALDRVYAAVYGEAPDLEMADEAVFWYNRFVWLEGYEPFDRFRSILLSVPAGCLIAWNRIDGAVRHSIVPLEVYRRTVLDLLAWLQIHRVGDFSNPRCWSCKHYLRSIRNQEYASALRRMTARENRAKKLPAKTRQRAGSRAASSG